MAAGNELTPSEYIQHHLSFFNKPVGEGGFWSLNVDSITVSILLGVVGLGFIWWVVRGATAGRAGQAPGLRRAADRFRRRAGRRASSSTATATASSRRSP